MTRSAVRCPNGSAAQRLADAAPLVEGVAPDLQPAEGEVGEHVQVQVGVAFHRRERPRLTAIARAIAIRLRRRDRGALADQLCGARFVDELRVQAWRAHAQRTRRLPLRAAAAADAEGVGLSIPPSTVWQVSTPPTLHARTPSVPHVRHMPFDWIWKGLLPPHSAETPDGTPATSVNPARPL